jgi:hypothetical protein
MPKAWLATAMDHSNNDDAIVSDYVGDVIREDWAIDASIAG